MKKVFKMIYPLKTKITMENPAFEDVFPIENGGFPMSYTVDARNPA